MVKFDLAKILQKNAEWEFNRCAQPHIEPFFFSFLIRPERSLHRCKKKKKKKREECYDFTPIVVFVPLSQTSHNCDHFWLDFTWSGSGVGTCIGLELLNRGSWIGLDVF